MCRLMLGRLVFAAVLISRAALAAPVDAGVASDRPVAVPLPHGAILLPGSAQGTYGPPTQVPPGIFLNSEAASQQVVPAGASEADVSRLVSAAFLAGLLSGILIGAGVVIGFRGG